MCWHGGTLIHATNQHHCEPFIKEKERSKKKKKRKKRNMKNGEWWNQTRQDRQNTKIIRWRNKKKKNLYTLHDVVCPIFTGVWSCSRFTAPVLWIRTGNGNGNMECGMWLWIIRYTCRCCVLGILIVLEIQNLDCFGRIWIEGGYKNFFFLREMHVPLLITTPDSFFLTKLWHYLLS